MSDAGAAIGILLILIGVGLFVGELLHPGVFLLIPGTVILVSGIMYIILPGFLTDTILGPAIVLLCALVATAVSIMYYKRVAPVHPPMVTIPSTLAGLEGIVVAPVVPDSLRGKVRVRSEIWSARSRVPIPTGAKVRILGGEGVSLEVVPLPESAPAGS